MNRFVFRLFWKFYRWFKNQAIRNLKTEKNIHESVELFFPIIFVGNINIGFGSYIMSNAELITGSKSSIHIGCNCAIARNVTIRTLTHNQNSPFKRLSNLEEEDIVIGDYCWIGTNVYIKEGVTIGNNVIIGANSIVTKSFPDNVVIGGVPAKVLKYREKF
jgi:maltose O-acetyltransferase